jgi:putative glutathione S-transferase
MISFSTLFTSLLALLFLSDVSNTNAFVLIPQKQNNHHVVETRTSASPTSRLFNNVDKGFNLLEIASNIVPQGQIVKTSKQTWNFIWKRFMTELAPQDKSGSYKRPKYTFGKTLGSLEFPIEDADELNKQRYHVYLGNPCPWCHRVKLVIEILQLPVCVTTLIDDPIRASRGGWILPPFEDDDVNHDNIKDLRQLYDTLQPGYTGRCTAPLLVDWKTKQIISNESKDIVRMLPLLKKDDPTLDLTPSDLLSVINETNDWIYTLLNNAVYRCGFSTTQKAYDEACRDVSEGLRRCQTVLEKQKYMASDRQITESDIMLLPTLLRFDGVYGPLFGAPSKLVRLECDYPAVYEYMKRCYATVPGVKESVDIEDACSSYYKQLFPLNPGGILPTPVTARSLRLIDENEIAPTNVI